MPTEFPTETDGRSSVRPIRIRPMKGKWRAVAVVEKRGHGAGDNAC